MVAKQSELPSHVEQTVEAVGQLHANHHNNTTEIQKFVNSVAAAIGRPDSILLLVSFIVSWIAGNLILRATGLKPWDPPPFAWLNLILATGAVFATVLILAAQRHEDQLGAHRDELALQLARLSEQKTAKIISMLDELRRDDPLVTTHEDREAQAMSVPSDPKAVLDAIKDAEAEQK